ncbi:AraC family ligand binding domain-containing protein, partial [Pandoraea sputorum]|uniref:AraC family ligand binding domain-containing protein n=1 Tax=Pandoraea sputorum TaxID=93222 RepID=UPI00355614E6
MVNSAQQTFDYLQQGAMSPVLTIRRYQGESPHHQHAFTQLVLPIHGRMEIKVQGHGARLDTSTAALVAPGMAHAQQADADSCFLVLDCPSSWLQDKALDTL